MKTDPPCTFPSITLLPHSQLFERRSSNRVIKGNVQGVSFFYLCLYQHKYLLALMKYSYAISKMQMAIDKKLDMCQICNIFKMQWAKDKKNTFTYNRSANIFFWFFSASWSLLIWPTYSGISRSNLFDSSWPSRTLFPKGQWSLVK